MSLSPSANLEQDPFHYLTLSFPGRGDLTFYWVCEISQLILGAVQMHLDRSRFREVAYYWFLSFFFFFACLFVFAINVSSCRCPGPGALRSEPYFCDSCRFHFVNLIFVFEKTAVCYLKQQIYGKLKMNINKNPINFRVIFTFSKWML